VNRIHAQERAVGAAHDREDVGAGPRPLGAAVSLDWLAPPPSLAYALLFVLSLPLIFWGIGQYGVVGADEAFYQDIAINMLESGNWFRLQSGSYQFVYDTFANAPLQYWLRGGVVSLFGDTALSMRIVSSSAALLTVFATHRLVVPLAGRGAAFLAALILLTNYQFLYLHSARTGELEPIVCLLLVLVADSFIRTVRNPGKSWLAHHIWLALLVNVKAPVIPIPLIAEIICLAAIPMARRSALAWLKLGLIVLPFASAWHILQAIQHREALATLVESVRYQASGEFLPGARGTLAGRVLYYARCLFFGAFPSILLLPLSLASMARMAIRDSDRDPRIIAARVTLIFPLVTLGFYLCISKTGPWYVIHAYPFLAAWIGVWLARLDRTVVSIGTLVYLAVALSLLFWVQPESWGLNPFADDAIRIPMAMRWRELSFLPHGPGVPLLAAIVMIGLLVVQRRGPAAFGPALMALLCVIFVGGALARSSAPLVHVGYLSPIAALAADLAERKEAGQIIPYPIEVPPSHPWVVNYYFWRDHDLRLAPSGGEPGDPSASRFLLVGRRVRGP
jgi:hypothetical protein